jgi:P27 family predicted phage terminase small subunit
MAQRGRPRKPARQKALEGNPGKRASSGAEPKFDGRPVKPKKLGKDAAEFWDTVVDRLAKAGVAKEIDTHSLTLLAEVWGHLRAAHRILLGDPLDKNARIAYTSYLAKWGEIAGRFGLDPSSRSRMTLPDPDSGGKLGKYNIA